MLPLVVREHLDDFLRVAADRADGAALPEFIAREFRESLTCWVLAHHNVIGEALPIEHHRHRSAS